MRKCRIFGDWHLGKVGFWDMATLEDFWRLKWSIWVQLTSNGNDGQNRFEVHISKNMAKMANFRHRIGQDGTFTPFLSDFDVRPHKNDELLGLTWASLGWWTQNHPRVVGSCPRHGPQLIAQNQLSKSFGPDEHPDLYKITDVTYVYKFTCAFLLNLSSRATTITCILWLVTCPAPRINNRAWPCFFPRAQIIQICISRWLFYKWNFEGYLEFWVSKPTEYNSL